MNLVPLNNSPKSNLSKEKRLLQLFKSLFELELVVSLGFLLDPLVNEDQVGEHESQLLVLVQIVNHSFQDGFSIDVVNGVERVLPARVHVGVWDHMNDISQLVFL